jgi:hypothetical protein
VNAVLAIGRHAAVALDHDRLNAIVALQLLGKRDGGLGAAVVVYGDVGPFGGELFGDGGAEAPGIFLLGCTAQPIRNEEVRMVYIEGTAGPGIWRFGFYATVP